MTGILILAHGSRQKQTEETLETVVEMVRKSMPNHLLAVGYMEFSDKTIRDGIQQLSEQGAKEIIVIPYFLFEGIHIQKDIPEELDACAQAHPGLTIRMGKTLGADPRLAEILCDRIREAL